MGLIHGQATIAIASGTALSPAFFIGAKLPVALTMPAAWDAADITFQVSDDGGATWTELLDDSGTAITISAPAAGKRLNISPGDFASAAFYKLRSGTAAIPVNQTADRTLSLTTRQFYPKG